MIGKTTEEADILDLREAREIMKRNALLFFILTFVVGCTTTRNISDKHPYADQLIGTYTTDKTIYLYRDKRGKRYSIFTYIYSVFPRVNGEQIEIKQEPQRTLPPGSKITIEDVVMVFDMAPSRAELHGFATIESGEKLLVSDIHEFVSAACDIDQTKRLHIHRLSEYIENLKEDKPSWLRE